MFWLGKADTAHGESRGISKVVAEPREGWRLAKKLARAIHLNILGRTALSHNYEVMKYCVTDYFRYIRSLEDTMRAIESDIAYQNARLNLMGVSLDGGGCAPNRDALPDGIIKLMELREKWSDEYAHCADDLEFARELCKPTHINRHIVWLHLVDRRRWDVVSREIGYSRRHTLRMSDAGVVEVYYSMPEVWRRDPIPNAL